MARGCYLCLEDILEQYELGPSGERRSPDAQKEAADAALLLLARSAELSFPADSESELATKLIRHPGHDTDLWPLLTSVVKSLPRDANGVGEELALSQRRPDDKTTTAWRGTLRQHRNDSLVSAYVYLSAECAFSFPAAPRPDEIDSRFSETPLIVYRLATCGQAGHHSLQFQLLNRDPRFFELAYFLGEAAATEDRESTSWYESAVDHLPLFTAARVALAEAFLEDEEPDKALVAIEPVLALVPTHHLARLIRVQALTGLGRHREALDAVAPLLQSSWHLGDAHYFKALNEYSEGSGDGDAVLADCEQALQYGQQARVFVLQGAQHLRRRAWESARQSFESAIDLEPDNCAALNYRAQASAGEGDLKAAAAGFERAHECYEERMRKADEEIGKLVVSMYLWPATADDAARRRFVVFTARRERLSKLREATQAEMEGRPVAIVP